MNIQDIIKLQLVSQFGAASSAAHHGHTGQQSFLAMLHHFLFMLFVSVIDDVGKALPKLCEEIKSFFVQKAKQKVHYTLVVRPQELKDASILLSTRHCTNSLVMTRTFLNTSESASSSTSSTTRASSDESDGMVDSILAHICKLDNVPILKLIDRGQIMVSYKEKPIQVAKDVFVKIDSITTANGDAVSSIRLTLLSNALSAAELAAYARNLYAKHQEELKNSLGNNIYFFDHKSKDNSAPMLPPSADADNIRNHRRMLISTAPKNLSFTMTAFYSNKSFANIFGTEIRAIEKRVRFFLDNRDWYDRKGVPYQLGLLLSGIPGAGKTSAIRAIANLTKRHIINVNFANIATATQLKNLFYSDKVTVYSDSSLSSTQTYFIPIEQRLYVLEEIDAIGDIVKQRSPYGPTDPQHSPIQDELTLAEILTVLDGTMEVPGRIVVMTSNHPEVLDKALIRPGRIDVQVHFDNANRELVAEMFEAYLDTPFPSDLLHELPDKLLSPAEVGQVIFRNFDTREDDKVAAVLRDLRDAADAKRGPPAVVSVSTDNKPDSVSVSTVETVDTTGNEDGEKQDYKVFEEDDTFDHAEIVKPIAAAAEEPASVTKEQPDKKRATYLTTTMDLPSPWTFPLSTESIQKSPMFDDMALPSIQSNKEDPKTDIAPFNSGSDFYELAAA